MYKYTDEELSNKIHTFLDRKCQKFPGIEEEAMKPVRKITVTQRSRSCSISTIRQMNAWA